MTTNDRLERRLPAMLDDYAVPRTPAYFDDIIRTTARTRQRPGWSFPERWFPMSAISERMATGPRVPWRMVAVAALLVLAAVAAAVLIAGSRQPRVPAPFGLAGNGAIALVDDAGAIVTLDVATGDSRVIVAGPGNRKPTYSPDGAHVAFLRYPPRADTELVVVDAQGGSPVVVASGATLLGATHVGWMPDSRRVVVDGAAGGLYAYDATAPAAPTTVVEAFESNGLQNELTNLFRPPAADEILVLGSGPRGEGLYRRPIEGGELIPILTTQTTAVPFSNLASPQWSPDGRKLAFSLYPPDNEYLGRAYVVNVDGTGLRRLSAFEAPSMTVDEGHVAWSPDGTRVAFGRWIIDAGGNTDVRPVTIVDLATGEESELPNIEINGYHGWSWSPDGTSILEVPGEGSGDVNQVLVIDAKTGEVSRPGWLTTNAATWQRVVP